MVEKSAKEKLMEVYSKVGFEISSELSDSFNLRFNKKELIHVAKEDIREYALFRESISDFLTKPGACSLCTSSFREQLLGPLSEGASKWLKSSSIACFGEKQNSELYVEIGPCSQDFFNYIRTDEFFLKTMRGELKSKLEELSESDPVDARYVYRPKTIRVVNMSEDNLEKALEISTEYIESCLLYLSMEYGFNMRLCSDWIDSLFLKDCYQPKEGFFATLPLPKFSYHSDLTSYYLSAQSHINPENQFLGYYHVLEYFFQSATEKNLKEDLTSILAKPDFTLDEDHLEILLDSIKTHRIDYRRDIDAFKLMLKTYLNESEAIAFIKEFHADINYKYYTQRINLFGEDVHIQLKRGHVWGEIAKRIYAIRNAIVHSSEKYSRDERFIPFSEYREIVQRELPLIRFLAEQIILATSKRIK